MNWKLERLGLWFQVASSRGHNRIKSNIPIISLYYTSSLNFQRHTPTLSFTHLFTKPSMNHFLPLGNYYYFDNYFLTYSNYFKIIKKCQLKSLKIEMLKIEITFFINIWYKHKSSSQKKNFKINSITKIITFQYFKNYFRCQI